MFYKIWLKAVKSSVEIKHCKPKVLNILAMKLLLIFVVSALFVGNSFCKQDGKFYNRNRTELLIKYRTFAYHYVELCTVDLASYGDARGTPQCLADAACYFYDEKTNKCLPYWRRPDAELRIKFHILEDCEKRCVN